jgi:hypothetical protein
VIKLIIGTITNCWRELPVGRPKLSDSADQDSGRGNEGRYVFAGATFEWQVTKKQAVNLRGGH